MTGPPRIALLAPFLAFDDWYSLSHVVRGQVKAIRSLGYEPEVWALRGAKGVETLDCDVHLQLTAQKMEYDNLDRERVERYVKDLNVLLISRRPDAVITHDVLLQGAYIDVAGAVHAVAPMYRDVLWMHYLHSVVDHRQPVTEKNVFRRTVPKHHVLLYPNASLRGTVAEYYSVDPKRVFTVTNVRDPRDMWNLDPLAERIVGECRLLQRDVVGVFPFCTTRIGDKGVAHAVALFERLKAKGLCVSLILCNSSANAEREKFLVHEVRETSTLLEDELLFTSTLGPEHECGVSNRVVSDLMRFADVFPFFSSGEAGPLTLAEAQAAGCIVAYNCNVPALKEFAGPNAVGVPLPAFGLECEFEATVNEVERDVITGKLIQERKKTYKGYEALDLVLKQAADAVISLLDCPSRSAKKFAFRTYSRESHAEGLVQAIGEVAAQC